MAASSKAQLLEKFQNQLVRRYKPTLWQSKRTVLEAVVFGICHEESTLEEAEEALARLRSASFDWNELRVSSVSEIEEQLNPLAKAELKAQRIKKFLLQLFSKTYGFDLEKLGKKPLKEAVQVLQSFESSKSDFVIATVVQQSLSGHAIPLDALKQRCLERLGVADPGTTSRESRPALERAVPKQRGPKFAGLLEALVHDVCHFESPDCASCALTKTCPTGTGELSTTPTTERAAKRLVTPQPIAKDKISPITKSDSEATNNSTPPPARKPRTKKS